MCILLEVLEGAGLGSLAGSLSALNGFKCCCCPPLRRWVERETSSTSLVPRVTTCCSFGAWGLGGCSFDKWIKVVMDEFFHIGDLEKQAGMKVSMNQCRKSTGIDKCQQGFIVFVVKPLYEQMTRLMPGVEPAMAQLLTNVATLSKKLAA